MPPSADSFIGDGYSTPAEVCLAIICAYLPTVSPFIRRIITATQSRFGVSSYSLSSTHHLNRAINRLTRIRV